VAAFIASGCGALVILSSPYVSDIVAGIQRAFGAGYRTTLAALLALAATAFLAAAVSRIRDHRALRYLALGVAVVACAAYSGVFGTGNPDIDLVEAFHFIEYGGLTVLFCRAWRRFDDVRRLVYPLLAGITVGILDEWLQWFIPSRVGELHDIALDLAAVLAGLLVAVAIDPPRISGVSVRDGAGRGVTAAATAVLVLLSAFVYSVHVGYEVRQSGIGTFRSRYDAVTLQLLAVERARAWRRTLPTYATRYSREDHYLTEGLWHVQERNDMLERGNLVAAWRENLILETFFTPLLDSPVLADRYRWSPNQRAEVEARVSASAGAAYVSAAEALPIYVLSLVP
jgi:VanZ family protein